MSGTGQQAQHGARRRPGSAQAGPSDVFVLDFDGVLVDSEPEISTAGLLAASAYWPELFRGLDAERRAAIVRNLKLTRPVLIKGFETMIMARLLLEDPACVDRILSNWDEVLSQALADWGLQQNMVVAWFGGFRKGLYLKHKDLWVRGNQLYPGILDAVKQCPYPFYIASSKGEERLVNLLQNLLGLDIQQGSPRIFAELLPPNERKIESLRTIQTRLDQRALQTGGKPPRLHFIDDRVETMLAVQQQPDLKSLQLYVADWGYNTPAELTAAKAAGLRVIGRPQFCELLKWGLLMEVDDGCEPTSDEVAAGV
ncbi:hypothetical protein WJX72_010962 [[Myrmecia] bisecta]|uniref:Haloacid dehalogenase-like hydrolase n=1 Tax=[Myrmecia] bisecta TaxID=41462 RepID=A0AAW1R927_9CHLO